MLFRLQVLFVPYALHDRDHYADVARAAFVEMGFELESIHQTGSSAKQAVKDAQSIFIGGGNTFRLLKALYDNDLVGKCSDLSLVFGTLILRNKTGETKT